MANFILFVSTMIIALSSTCHSSIVHDDTGRSLGDCIFGPFGDTVEKCMSHGWKFTGCLLNDLNWFRKNGLLHSRKVLDSFTAYVKNQELMPTVRFVIRKCIKTANGNGTSREEVADNFVKCLNMDNAFAALFPEAFCEEEKDYELITSANISLADESKKETEETSNCTNCGLGPFKKNYMRCISMARGYDHCLLYHLGLYTEDDKIDISELFTMIELYIVNSEHKEHIHKVIKKCVEEANASNYGRKSVGNGLVKCWIRENAFRIFQLAFCSKAEQRNWAISQPIPLAILHQN